MDYKKAQEEWLKITGVREGSRVKVLFKAGKDSGWGTYWADEMDECIGNVYEVKSIHPQTGLVLSESAGGGYRAGYSFPFYSLVKEDK